MRTYEVVPAGGGLEEKIISAASGVQQKQTIWRWIDGVFEEFRLPAPAFCLALFLLIGFAAGIATYGDRDAYPASDSLIEQLLYEEEYPL